VAEIHPFRGIYYDPLQIPQLSSVICPPYDVISHQRQEDLYHLDPHNFVRVEHARELPQDTAEDNKYTRSAATLEQWLDQGALQIDPLPSLYLHHHYFNHRGRRYRRQGITVRVRLEEWSQRVILPHEGTLSRAKDDRINLLRACMLNTSPILAMFSDHEQQISRLLSTTDTGQPLIDIDDVEGEGHRLWAVTDPGIIDQLAGYLAGQPLYIADGHHRYESALAYRRERYAYDPAASPDAAFNYIMMTLVDFADPGLIVLPPHRLVRGISKSTLDEFQGKLASFFDIDELPLAEPNCWDKLEQILLATAAESAGRVRLVLFGPATQNLLVLSLRPSSVASQLMPYFHCDLYKRLDVSVVDHIILEELLGMGSGQQEDILNYTYDMHDAINRVQDQEYQMALLVRPVRPEIIKAVSDANDRMPHKSTYFYPKLPSGLVCNLVR